MSNLIRILIADDHGVLRGGLKAMLGLDPEFLVVGEASDGCSVLQLAEKLKPDLVLLDISMPGKNGIEVTLELHQIRPEARVLILTLHEEEVLLRQALRAGASGYIVKSAADTDLLNAIRSVMRGEIYIHPSLIHMLVKDLTPLPARKDSSTVAALTLREIEVLRLIARGCTNRHIGELLHLSVRTVEGHRASLMDKLHLHSRVELITYAEENKLLD